MNSKLCTMNSKEYSPCDYVNRVQDNKPKPLTRAFFETLLEDMNVRFLTEKVREHKPDAEQYKKQLPGICWQARFGGGLRTDKNAQPTGLFCLDVDYHHEQHFADLCRTEGPEAAWRWAEQLAHENAEKWAQMQRQQDENPGNLASHPELDLSIVAIHVSPQNAGVHVVATCNSLCKSIEENQARLARLLGTSYDAVCKDWARLFFVTPKENWTYLDSENLFPKNEELKMKN